MKKGFTMIELIFVIVILGILASVAIPKLAATRDDAELAKASTNVSTVIADITAYYTAKGAFATNLGDMTNVPLDTGNLMVKGKKCVNFAVAGTTLTVKAGDNKTDDICDKLLKVKSVEKMVNPSDNNGQAYHLGSDGVNWN